MFDIEEEIERWYVLLNNNQASEVIDICRQILDIDPKNFDARLILQRALTKNGDYEEALDINFKDLRRTPDNHYIMTKISKIYDLIGNYDLSLEWAEKEVSNGLKKKKKKQ